MSDIEPEIGKNVTFAASELADNWAMSRLRATDHGWHGHGCQTCTGRYVTLCFAFDAGYHMGFDDALAQGENGGDD